GFIGGAAVCAYRALERDSAATIPSIESLNSLRTQTLLFVPDSYAPHSRVRYQLFLKEVERLSVGPDELVDPHRVRVVLGNISAGRDGVSGLQGVLVPAGPGQLVRSGQFGLPLFDFTFVVLHIKKKVHVRINKTEIRHHSLDRDYVLRIVRRRAMVSE